MTFNTNCIKALEQIKSANNIIILPHKNPDIDTIATSLALFDIIKNKLQKKAKIITCSNLIKFQNNLACLDFLQGFRSITNVLPAVSKYDLCIYIDCANKKRVSFDIDNNVFSINIDHHNTKNKGSNFADINLVDEHCESSSGVLYKFTQANKISLSLNSAYGIYCGIASDSDYFTSQKTNLNTFDIITKLLKLGIDIKLANNNLLKRQNLSKFRILPKILQSLTLSNSGNFAFLQVKQKHINKFKAKLNDCNEVANSILGISIVKVVFFLQELKTIKTIKVSIRSYDNFSALDIATIFKGGGHNDKASFTLKNIALKKAKKEILKKLKIYKQGKCK
jgi:phosphoesterase RecJ-like protein